jgi:hypothetical protein
MMHRPFVFFVRLFGRVQGVINGGNVLGERVGNAVANGVTTVFPLNAHQAFNRGKQNLFFDENQLLRILRSGSITQWRVLAKVGHINTL